MAGLCRRLLAAFLLILFAAVLRGQDSSARAPILKEELGLPGHAVPVWTPVPGWPTSGSVGRSPVGSYPVVPGSAAFPQIVQAAGIIFSGLVTAVGHGGASGAEPASTTVTFQVQRAMRGVSLGQSLTIREWAGLWASGERYRVGERVFLILYPPSKLGLTSPVAGNMGRFAINSRGMIVITPQHAAALLPDPILGGRTLVPYKDFAKAVQRFGGEE